MADGTPRRSRGSLRVRLTATAVAVLGAGLVAGTVLLLVVLHQVLVNAVDSSARQRARDVAELVVEDRLPDPLPVSDPSASVQVLDKGGHVLAASVGGDRLVPLVTTADVRRLRAGVTVQLDAVRLGSSGALRVVGVAADTIDGPRTVVVAVPASDVTSSVQTVGRASAVALPVLLLAVGALSWRLVGSAMRPVEALRAGAAEITATGTTRRLPVPSTADELRRLAETLNAMLDSLAAAERRTRSFVADAAHELRSPLATLRLQLEVALAYPGDVSPDGTEASEGSAGVPASLLSDLLADVDRLTHLVEDLLLLARTDAGATLGPREPLDLRQLAAAVVDRHDWRVPVALGPRPPLGGEVRVLGDPDALGRMLGNLVDNAVRHARSRVRVVVDRISTGGEPWAVLEVVDDGPGIAPGDRDRVIERFVRLDAARSRDAGGSGLGLAIVKEIVRAHGGRLELTDASPGLVVRVTLPAA